MNGGIRVVAGVRPLVDVALWRPDRPQTRGEPVAAGLAETLVAELCQVGNRAEHRGRVWIGMGGDWQEVGGPWCDSRELVDLARWAPVVVTVQARRARWAARVSRAVVLAAPLDLRGCCRVYVDGGWPGKPPWPAADDIKEAAQALREDAAERSPMGRGLRALKLPRGVSA